MEQLDPQIITLSETLLVDPSTSVVPDSAQCTSGNQSVSGIRPRGNTTVVGTSLTSASNARKRGRSSAPLPGGLMGVLAGLGSVKLKKTKRCEAVC